MRLPYVLRIRHRCLVSPPGAADPLFQSRDPLWVIWVSQGLPADPFILLLALWMQWRGPTQNDRRDGACVLSSPQRRPSSSPPKETS